MVVIMAARAAADRGWPGEQRNVHGDISPCWAHVAAAVDRAAVLRATIITFVECFILYSEVPFWIFRGCLSA